MSLWAVYRPLPAFVDVSCLYTPWHEIAPSFDTLFLMSSHLLLHLWSSFHDMFSTIATSQFVAVWTGRNASTSTVLGQSEYHTGSYEDTQ